MSHNPPSLTESQATKREKARRQGDDWDENPNPSSTQKEGDEAHGNKGDTKCRENMRKLEQHHQDRKTMPVDMATCRRTQNMFRENSHNTYITCMYVIWMRPVL